MSLGDKCCNHANATLGGTMSEDNKAAARAVFTVWSTGAIDRLDDLVDRDVVHHDPYDPNAAEGLDGMKRTIELNRRAFPDMRLIVEDQVAEGDKVVTRWRGEMTHLGELSGATPTGNRVTISGITIDRFEHGKIVEAWRSMDMLSVMRQIEAPRNP
jgi:predicted ester cyclase